MDGTKKLKLVKTNSVRPRALHRRVRGYGTTASGPFKMGVPLVCPRVSVLVGVMVRRNIGVIFASTKGPGA